MLADFHGDIRCVAKGGERVGRDCCLVACRTLPHGYGHDIVNLNWYSVSLMSCIFGKEEEWEKDWYLHRKKIRRLKPYVASLVSSSFFQNRSYEILRRRKHTHTQAHTRTFARTHFSSLSSFLPLPEFSSRQPVPFIDSLIHWPNIFVVTINFS